MCAAVTVTGAAIGNPAADMAAFDADMHAVLFSLRGTVLEIGAGEGANFAHFRRDIDWVGLEPNRGRRRRLARLAVAHGYRRPVLDARAEQIPLPDASVDAVASTVVLCSVDDQRQTLAEIRRVLRPGGLFAFFEHVAAPEGTWSRRLQGLCAPLCRALDAGCDPARETWRVLETAGFRELSLRWYSRRPGFGLYNPFIGGVAHV